MGGGILNLVSTGNSNLLIYGNPQKNIFKTKYKKISNFGQQKFEILPNGTESMSELDETTFRFKIPRHGDLLGDCCLCIDLPDIWSPIFRSHKQNIDGKYTYYESAFKWIDELGTNMINEVTIESGGHTLARYTGEYFSAVAHRDKKHKIHLWNDMTGNVPELNNPANVYGRSNIYPNAYYEEPTPSSSPTTYHDNEITPSILGRRLFIPLETWFSKSPAHALPLISLQYTELFIVVKLKPLNQLYVVKDYTNTINNTIPSYGKPLKTHGHHRFGVYLKPPTTNNKDDLGLSDFRISTWNPNIHLVGHYYFLDKVERIQFAKQEHKYLIHEVYNETFLDITGEKLVDLNVKGLVSSYMFRLRRNDAYKRNEWSNYTNWAYNHIPFNLSHIDNDKQTTYFQTEKRGNDHSDYIKNINKREYLQRNILKSTNILLDGIEREKSLDVGVYKYIEPYMRTEYDGKDDMYFYNYSCYTNHNQHQPFGGMNLDKFNEVQLSIKTILPPSVVGEEGAVNAKTIKNPANCDQDITIKQAKYIFEYNYDLEVFTERFNVIVIKSGTIGLLFAR